MHEHKWEMIKKNEYEFMTEIHYFCRICQQSKIKREWSSDPMDLGSITTSSGGRTRINYRYYRAKSW